MPLAYIYAHTSHILVIVSPNLWMFFLLFHFHNQHNNRAYMFRQLIGDEPPSNLPAVEINRSTQPDCKFVYEYRMCMMMCIFWLHSFIKLRWRQLTLPYISRLERGSRLIHICAIETRRGAPGGRRWQKNQHDTHVPRSAGSRRFVTYGRVHHLPPSPFLHPLTYVHHRTSWCIVKLVLNAAFMTS